LKILSVFLILLIFAIPDVWAQVNIENDQYYVGNDGIIHIVGEILNELFIQAIVLFIKQIQKL